MAACSSYRVAAGFPPLFHWTVAEVTPTAWKVSVERSGMNAKVAWAPKKAGTESTPAWLRAVTRQ